MSSEGVSAANERSKSSRVTVPLINMASPDLFDSAELEFRLVAPIRHFMTFSPFYCEERLPKNIFRFSSPERPSSGFDSLSRRRHALCRTIGATP